MSDWVPPQRKRRAVYPERIDRRVPAFHQLLDAQLMKYDTSAKYLWTRIGATSQTTIINRVRAGNLTIRDMLWINDFFPLDWNEIFETLREKQTPAEQKLDTEKDFDLEEARQSVKTATKGPQLAEINPVKTNPKATRFGNLLGMK